MTILWFGLGLCIALFIFFCVLSAFDGSNKTNNVAQEPPFRNPSPELENGTKDCNHPLNISEPVLSFVETVRKQPQRFHTRVVNDMLLSFAFDSTPIYRKYYYLRDNKTGEIWDTDPYSYVTGLSSHSWLTKDEMSYLVKEVTVVYEARKDRAEKLKTLRKQRRDKQERSRLMKIYAEGSK